jgi:hypothetical protein
MSTPRRDPPRSSGTPMMWMGFMDTCNGECRIQNSDST